MASLKDKQNLRIGAVIDFCAAKNIKISRTQIFQFFGVPQQTGSNWFPMSYAPNLRRGPQQTSTGPENRSLSDQQSSPPKRQNPVRNDGRGRKKLKSVIAGMQDTGSEASSPPPPSTPALSEASSSPAPEEPLTPLKRKIAQPGKKRGSRQGHQVKEEEELAIKSEYLEDEIEV